MSVRMVTYPGEVRTALNDAIVYRAAVSTGVLRGLTCSVGSAANIISVADGYALIQGRLIEINSESIQIPLAPSGTLNGRIYIQADPSNSSNPAQLLYATGSTLPDLTQDNDINDGGVYQLEICTFTVSTTGVSGIVNVVTIPDGGMHVYTSPADFGLVTPGIAELHAALPIGSMCVVSSADLATGATPTSGVVRITKLTGHEAVELLADDGKEYRYANNVWTVCPAESDIFYQPGDRVHFILGTAGYMTSGTVDLRFLTPWSKLIGKVSGVRVLGGTVTLRQNNKYLAENLKIVQRSGTSGNCYPEIMVNGLWLTLTKNAGWGGINNDVVGIAGAVDIEFS